MNDNDKLKVFTLRCKSKTGGKITRTEIRYLESMMKKYSEEYKSMDKEIFEETKPFGSTREYR